MALGSPPVIMHLINRLSVGGLENGLVNLVNGTSPSRYRHIIVCLTEATEFCNRITNPAVQVETLRKPGGVHLPTYTRFLKLCRLLRPAILHTRNLPALEFSAVGALAGVSIRIHGEHGWDVHDQLGTSHRIRLFRRIMGPVVTRYITVSEHLAGYLRTVVRIPPSRITTIHNGVDIGRFIPRVGPRRSIQFTDPIGVDGCVFGTVGRMEVVKDQVTLAKAFTKVLEWQPSLRRKIRLVMIGRGTLEHEVEKILNDAQTSRLSWLPGERQDIPELLHGLDVFVLPSLAEGMSNTVLEAMASGLPVIATRVGGNPELVIDGETGFLVPPSDPVAMARAMMRYLSEPDLVARHGRAARRRAEQHFSLGAMVERYINTYDTLLSTVIGP